jgi:hypothetical protein
MSPAVLIVVALAGAAALLPVLARRRANRRRPYHTVVRDPVREARAERRARELLRSTAGPDVYEMYAQLGFVAVEAGDYGYLIYPHRPIVAYDTESREPLSEYCVRFPDDSERSTGDRLPDADDVLAKWMALRGDERRLIREANMHLLGRQLDPEMVRRDLVNARAFRRRSRGTTRLMAKPSSDV